MSHIFKNVLFLVKKNHFTYSNNRYPLKIRGIFWCILKLVLSHINCLFKIFFNFILRLPHQTFRCQICESKYSLLLHIMHIVYTFVSKLSIFRYNRYHPTTTISKTLHTQNVRNSCHKHRFSPFGEKIICCISLQRLIRSIVRLINHHCHIGLITVMVVMCLVLCDVGLGLGLWRQRLYHITIHISNINYCLMINVFVNRSL